MSKMAELVMDIEDMYFDEHLDIPKIAKKIGLSSEDVAAYILSINHQNELDESMYGDFDSAMASAGFGTDEDYGCSAEDML